MARRVALPVDEKVALAVLLVVYINDGRHLVLFALFFFLRFGFRNFSLLGGLSGGGALALLAALSCSRWGDVVFGLVRLNDFRTAERVFGLPGVVGSCVSLPANLINQLLTLMLVPNNVSDLK